MSLIDQFQLEELVNEAERLVLDELERQLSLIDDADICKSPDCVLDMAAFALNAVSPMYRVNLMGRIFADAVSKDREAEIAQAVAAAIEKVQKNPPVS